MNIHFDSEVAKVVGVDGAIMLNNLNFWIIKNEANGKHFYDGHYWTYNSIDAFTKIFDFWSKRQIERILKNLKEKEFIITGNYNKQQYDRTVWYALTEKGKALLRSNPHEYSFHQTGKCISPNGEMAKTLISPNGEMDSTKRGNGFHQTVKPIPYNNTNNNTDIYMEIWKAYPVKKGKAIAFKKLPMLLNKYSKEELIKCIERYKAEFKNNDYSYMVHGSTFFNGKYEDYLDENYMEIEKPKVTKNDKPTKKEYSQEFINSLEEF